MNINTNPLWDIAIGIKNDKVKWVSRLTHNNEFSNEFVRGAIKGLDNANALVQNEFKKIADMEKDLIPNPIKDLIREVIMRHNLAFPETEQDMKWFEQKPDGELMVRLFEYLELGDGITGDIRNNKGFWNNSK